MSAAPPVTGDDSPRAVVLYDGPCNLCNAAVRFILPRDRSGYFRFAALDSDAGRSLLAANSDRPLPDSLALLEDGRVFVRSAAVLRIARRLRFPWPIAYAFVIIPRPLRDWTYDGVARNRYRWFGKRESCMMPTDDMRGRFLS